MNDQNRLRLERIAARQASRAAPAPSAPELKSDDTADAAFLAAFERAQNGVLRPVMAEVGLQLRRAGYLFQISSGGEASTPSIDLHLVIPGRGDSKDIIRFFAAKDPERGWQVIAELELKRSPFELTRFEATEELDHDVVEQLLVDAVEQMFASTGGEDPRSKSPPLARAAPPAPAPTPVPPAPAPVPPAPEIASMGPWPSQPLAAPPALPPVPAPVFVPAVATTPAMPPTRASVTASAQPNYLSLGAVVENARGPALPFDPSAGPGHPRPQVLRPPPEFGGTSVGVVLPLGPALPFDPSAGPGRPQPQVPRAPSQVGSPSIDVYLGLAPAPPFDPSTGRGRPQLQVPRAPSEVGRTSLDVQLGLAPALPFDTGTGPGHPRPPVLRAPAEFSGTSLSVELPLGAALPFDPSPGADPSQPGVVPLLTLEQYAKLRARLMVEGEDDQQVWKEFGVTSRTVKEALQARFAAQFRSDPAAQSRFVELIPRLVSELRSG